MSLAFHRLDRCAAVLSDAERVSADRFRFDRDRQRYVLSHGALRLLPARYTGQPAATLRLELGPHGKPRLAGHGSGAAIEFNLSHSAAALAPAAGRSTISSQLPGYVGAAATARPAGVVRALRLTCEAAPDALDAPAQAARRTGRPANAGMVAPRYAAVAATGVRRLAPIAPPRSPRSATTTGGGR
jgi:4'-phosphopantetheinyl transferase